MGEPDEAVELALEFQGLQISVRGPSFSAARFVAGLASSPAPSTTSSGGTAAVDTFEVVRPSSSTTSSGYRGRETRASIEPSFPNSPPTVLALAGRLSGMATYTGPERIQRAFLAGPWAKGRRPGDSSSWMDSFSKPAEKDYLLFSRRGGACPRDSKRRPPSEAKERYFAKRRRSRKEKVETYGGIIGRGCDKYKPGSITADGTAAAPRGLDIRNGGLHAVRKTICLEKALRRIVASATLA